MIAALQIIGFIFALTMIYFALLHYRKNTLSSGEFMSWLGIWIVVLLMVAFPDLFRTFAQEVLFTRLFDLMVVGGFVILLCMVSISYIKSNRSERKLEELVRELSLKNGKGKKS